MNKFSDQQLINILEAKINEGKLEYYMINIAKMCIDTLKNGNDDDKKRARNMCSPFIKEYFNSDNVFVDNADERNVRKNIYAKTIKKIDVYLNSVKVPEHFKKELITCYKILTDSNSSQEQLTDAALLVEARRHELRFVITPEEEEEISKIEETPISSNKRI